MGKKRIRSGIVVIIEMERVKSYHEKNTHILASGRHDNHFAAFVLLY